MSFGCSFGAGYRTLGVAIASIQHDHRSDDDICGRAIWNYEKHDPWFGSTSYSRSAPINVFLKRMDVNDVGTALEDQGWDNLENDFMQEGKRYAYDKDREMFVGPDNEPQGTYGGWGNYAYGFLGRMSFRPVTKLLLTKRPNHT